MNKITISVIMPVYNGSKYLREAIDSILGQTFTDFELIIINDGSTDNTEGIILSYQDPRISYIKNTSNLKLIKTLNKGVDLARGKYIARMDADDISLPDRFKRQLEVFESSPDVDIVNANPYLLKEDGSCFRKQKSSLHLSHEAIRYLIPLQNLICHPAVMVKSELLKKYRYIDDQSREHIEDYDLWNRMLMDGRVCFTSDQNLLLYRSNPVSINHTQKSRQVERMYSLSDNFLFDRFAFKMDKQVLDTVLSEDPPDNAQTLKKINGVLASYTSMIKDNHVISTEAYNELEVWRKQKMVLLSLKSLSRTRLIKKPAVLLFLLSHLHWFRSNELKVFGARIVYTRNIKRPLSFA